MSPSRIQSLLLEAVELHRKGQYGPLDKACRQLRAAAPKNFHVFYLSGLVAYQQQRTTEAVEMLTRAHQLDRTAVVGEMWLGLALMQAGRHEEAEKHLRHVVEQKPDFGDGWARLAMFLQRQDRLKEAIACHEKVVALKPKDPGSWIAYGLTLSFAGYPTDALQCHEYALALDAGNAEARFARAQALQQSHRISEAIEDYSRFLAAQPARHDARSYRLYALHNVDTLSREELFAEHLAYGRAVRESPVPTWANSAEPDRKLRIAFLSPDLRAHSVAYFLEPLLQYLDPAQFEVHLYHDHFREDDVSARLRALSSGWRNFFGQSETVVESAIRADAPDLLIDLAGHTSLNRLPLFARRLAPVQITYLGYPNTTGLTAMDYRFTDAIADPVGEADSFATERLVRFAPTAWTYAPPAEAPSPDRQPNVPGMGVTFGCFNNLAKVTDAMLGVWAQLLRRVPNSRLLLKGVGLDEAPVQARYHERMRRSGIAVERVDFLGKTARTPEHLACYGRVDVALDTFPYHGTTTTCEALWMGVPVVTMAGDRHVSRVGASLLRAVGHAEWITTTAEDYVAVVAELAADEARRATLRTGLRKELQRSVLLNRATQSGRFAAALRDCWRAWCARQVSAA
jgi:predicted O-linked N-acetylglucosamine transferase (SPINDLY family)